MCMKWILMIISIIDGLNKVENYKKVFGWYLNRRTKVEIYLKTNSNKFTWLIVSFSNTYYRYVVAPGIYVLLLKAHTK